MWLKCLTFSVGDERSGEEKNDGKGERGEDSERRANNVGGSLGRLSF